MTLAAHLAGVSEDEEKRCDAWFAGGEELRAAVGWRWFQRKGEVLSAVSGVPMDALRRFVETGDISDEHRRLLDSCK